MCLKCLFVLTFVLVDFLVVCDEYVNIGWYVLCYSIRLVAFRLSLLV